MQRDQQIKPMKLKEGLVLFAGVQKKTQSGRLRLDCVIFLKLGLWESTGLMLYTFAGK